MKEFRVSSVCVIIKLTPEIFTESENGPVFNFPLLEREFDKSSPDMQRYLIWLQKAAGSGNNERFYSHCAPLTTGTASEYLFGHRDQSDVNEDISQR